MSKASDTLNAIKSALGMEVKLATMKLDDGVTVLEADSFESGNAVNIVTEDDQRIALPVGEYTLEDGMMLVIKEEGIIDSLVEKEEEVKEEVTEPVVEEEVAASDKPTETVATPKKVVEAISKESYFSSEDMEAIGKLIDSKLADFKSNLTLSTDVQDKEEEKEEKEITENVELTSEDVAAAKPITHNPENKTQFAGVKYAQNRQQTTLDRVMEKLSK
tara:strand:- start:194 stop:847 length:654 start_codon:yes stop_codon:yes gene_type:complete